MSSIPHAKDVSPLPVDQLRWACDPAQFAFETTNDVEPIQDTVGQDAALESLRFGLAIDAPGQNIFVRGGPGTGRRATVQRLLTSMALPQREMPDHCYVHDFERPDRPRLLSLPHGSGRDFQQRMERFAEFVREELAPALTDQVVRAERAEIDARFQARSQEVSAPFEAELRGKGLAMSQVQAGGVVRPAIVPLVEDIPVPVDQIDDFIEQGKIAADKVEALQRDIQDSMRKLEEVGLRLGEVRESHAQALRTFIEAKARAVLARHTAALRAQYPGADVACFLDEVVTDCATKRLAKLADDVKFTELYRVNLLLTEDRGTPPLITEEIPTLGRLVGRIEPVPDEDGQVGPLHLAIRAGSLVRADGGYLLLDASDVAQRPEAWAALVRTLRCGRCELVSPERAEARGGPALKPEAIPVNVKVILLGNARLYATLDALDSDFPHLFKVLADFDSTIPRNADGLAFYAGVLANAQRAEGLRPFTRSAVALLIEHGARIASQRERLTSRFSRLFDLAREASFLAQGAGQPQVEGDDVRAAVRRTKERASLPSRKFRESIARGTIRLMTSGSLIGQVNGLAVIKAGPLAYGFPSRITATIGPGQRGTINIEREAELSGSIHTKGFYILGGLLRYLLRTDHPLAFDASIAFEQSYGGIDGDSASGAEMCCLLSALTDVPLRQDLAMTGAIDQVGNILPIGAVNEKVEGFFDTCSDSGLTGTQGVIIPQANAGDLMLREDVTAAAKAGRFQVYAVSSIVEAISLFTSRPSDEVLSLAMQRARHFWDLIDGEPQRTVDA